MTDHPVEAQPDARGRTGDSWTQRLDAIFGDHRLEVDARESARPEIFEVQRDLLKFWKVKHGAQKVIVRGTRPDRNTMLDLIKRARQNEVLNLIRNGRFLLFVVEQGEAAVDLYSGSITLGPGDALLLTAMEPFVVSTGADFAGLWVAVPNWWLMELCQGQMRGARERLDAQRGATIVLRTTLSVLLEDGRGPVEVNDLVDMLGAVLARNLLASDMGAPDQEGQIERIRRFVADNYQTPGLSPRDAAQALGCSISSIHKCCASVGWTFGGLVTGMRISVAAYRLNRTPQSISAVAFECGYTSLPHFCHAFKAYYGVTASSVRKQHAVA